MALPRILVIDAAALGYDLVQAYPDHFAALGLAFSPLEPVFPAVTSPAQATFRTGLPSAVSCDPTRVRGTHGRIDRPAAMAATFAVTPRPSSLLELSAAPRQRLEAS